MHGELDVRLVDVQVVQAHARLPPVVKQEAADVDR
jgi:hypothetical protein